jgi:phosphatidylglycerophosphatase A
MGAGNKISIEKKITPVTRLCAVVGSLFGTGYTSFMPGTAACVFALPFYVLIRDPMVFAAVTIISTIISYVVCGQAERFYGIKDCKKIVIDDFSGQLITFLFVPFDIRFLISGFFLFRMLDMLKIPPADRLEERSGSQGIVGDDVVAGIYANAILQIACLLASFF